MVDWTAIATLVLAAVTAISVMSWSDPDKVGTFYRAELTPGRHRSSFARANEDFSRVSPSRFRTARGRSRERTTGSASLAEEVRHWLPVDARERTQFDHIEPPLAALCLAHECLRSTHPFRHLRLRQPSFLPSRAKPLQEVLLIFRSTPDHGVAASSPFWDRPKWGRVLDRRGRPGALCGRGAAQ